MDGAAIEAGRLDRAGRMGWVAHEARKGGGERGDKGGVRAVGEWGDGSTLREGKKAELVRTHSKPTAESQQMMHTSSSATAADPCSVSVANLMR